MDDTDASPEQGELTPRAPTRTDVIALCRRLNELGARYMVVGGFAIIEAGYPRSTGDLDLLVSSDLVNEAKVYKALESLADKAVLELKPGEIGEYTVIRIHDEYTVDLMASTSGITLDEALDGVVYHDLDGVTVPFASPKLLWRMKEKTYREKDVGDLIFLRQQYSKEIFGDSDG
jgi:hypothetical protein